MLSLTIKGGKNMKKIIGYVTSSSNTLVFNYDKPISKDYKVIRISIPDDMQIMYSMANKLYFYITINL